MSQTFLVTGGAGFIGSHLVDMLLGARPENRVVVYDALTYAGSMDNLAEARKNPRFSFVKGDVADEEAVAPAIEVLKPDCVFHLAAETHVDRSIGGPKPFLRTNTVGTFEAMNASLRYWQSLSEGEREKFRFVLVSTDEVYGSMAPGESATEDSPYRPNSPYAASKAAADHFARAMHSTYGFPVITTHCTNNYGPRQFPEKLIPVVISRALAHQAIPIYGDGKHSRDWLHVADHCQGLIRAAEIGVPGMTYNFGADCEMTTSEVVDMVLGELDLQAPMAFGSYRKFITQVEDRLGHDRRYALACERAKAHLGWEPKELLVYGIYETVAWYVKRWEREKKGSKR